LSAHPKHDVPAPPPPLVVDLDGTLLRSDLLVETGLRFLREHPHRFWQPLVWLFAGKAALKDRLAATTAIEADLLPYNADVILAIRDARSQGRRVVLATASHRTWAVQVAEHLGLFDEVLATQGTLNLSAGRKRDVLVDRFGEHGFDYLGNSHDDLPIFAAARRGYLVNPQPGLIRRLRATDAPVEVLVVARPSLVTWLRALRLHQWLKNLLLFVPLLASHRIADAALLFDGLLAFMLFGMCASSVYVLNDLLDLPDDRRHPKKRGRPFASGALSVKTGLIAVPALLLFAFAGSALLLPWAFTAILAGYYVLTLAYSLDLKRRMMVDVLALAALYTARVIAGGAAFGLELTFWMLAFSMFIFLSLAMVKRYAELHAAAERGETMQTPGRGYWPADLGMVSVLGAASGYLAVLVLALYIHDEATAAMYAHPEWIWLAVPLLLFWISRVWMLAHRGQMHEDPLLFAVRDRTSLFVGALFLFVFWIAT
jgi:4-hydroxybenzoate polyprenyltransferase/phosphoserine phosphatase